MAAFARQYKLKRQWPVGGPGIPIEEFWSQTAVDGGADAAGKSWQPVLILEVAGRGMQSRGTKRTASLPFPRHLERCSGGHLGRAPFGFCVRTARRNHGAEQFLKTPQAGRQTGLISF
jgi:hypothetical protein